MIAIVFYIKIKPLPANIAPYDVVGDLEEVKEEMLKKMKRVRVRLLFTAGNLRPLAVKICQCMSYHAGNHT